MTTSSDSLSEPAKLLLLASLLSNDRIISKNGKSFLKELILRRDNRLGLLLKAFEGYEAGDASFIEQIHEIIKEEAEIVYNDLFSGTSIEVGKTLSKSERDRKNLNSEKSLIYGEVEFASFYDILRKLNPEPGLVFYDLGSGTGKAIFAARLTQDFSRCLGIEILESLHTEATSIVDKFNSTSKNVLSSEIPQIAAAFEGSFLDYDWSDGDIIFANSTCFSDDLMLKMSEQAEMLKPGAIVVTFTKGMSSKKFELIEKKRYKMSWGPATVFLHRKLAGNGKPIGPVKLFSLPRDDIEYDTSTHDASSSDEDNGSCEGSDDGEVSDEIDEVDEDDEDDDDGTDDYVNVRSQPDLAVFGTKMKLNIPAAMSNMSYPDSESSPVMSLNDSFGSLNSPQDSALLMRKRAGRNPVLSGSKNI